MSDKQHGDNSFEGLEQTNTHGAEYWSARDLQPLLGYSQWQRFEQAVGRAISSCKQSRNNPNHRFAGAGRPITGGLSTRSSFSPSERIGSLRTLLSTGR